MIGRYVGLIRGINIGRAKRVAMADLRSLVEGLGYTDVRTLLNSGNVVFTGHCPDQTQGALVIEAAIADKTGVKARVTILSAGEVIAAIDENPLREVADDPSRLLVTVLNQPVDRTKLEPLMKQAWTPDVLALGTRVAYLWCAEGILASRLAGAVGKTLGDGATSRNWATMIKLKGLI